MSDTSVEPENRPMIQIQDDICDSCGAEGHNPNANYCWNCGGKNANPGKS